MLCCCSTDLVLSQLSSAALSARCVSSCCRLTLSFCISVSSSMRFGLSSLERCSRRQRSL